MMDVHQELDGNPHEEQDRRVGHRQELDCFVRLRREHLVQSTNRSHPLHHWEAQGVLAFVDIADDQVHVSLRIEVNRPDEQGVEGWKSKDVSGHQRRLFVFASRVSKIH